MFLTWQFSARAAPLVSRGWCRTQLARTRARVWRGPAVLLLFSLFAGEVHASELVIVTSSDAEPYLKARTAIEEQLFEKGHETRSLRLSDLTPKEAESLRGNAVIAVGTKAVVFLRHRLPKSVLLVYCLVADPGRAGLDGDPPVHGVSASVPIVAQLEFIAEALPQTRSIGMLYHAGTSSPEQQRAEVQKVLPPGWKLEAVAIDDHDSVPRAINDLMERDIDIVLTTTDRAIYDRTTVRSLLLAGLRHKVPVFGYSLPFVRAGALLGVAVDPRAQGVQAATIAHRLLNRSGGGQEEPVREDPVFEKAINLIVAEKLSISIRPTAVKSATHVFRR